MNRYDPVVFMAVGLAIAAAIGGAVTIMEVGTPFADLDRSTDASVERATDNRAQKALRVTTESTLISDRSGNLVRIKAVVENPHKTAINEDIALRVDEDQDGAFEMTAGKQSLTVSARATVTLEFTVRKSRLGPGTYEYVVETADGTAHWATGSFVLQPATFVINEVVTEAVLPGEPASITASVSNVGDFSGEQPIEVVIVRNPYGVVQSSELVSSEKVSIAVNDRQNVTFQVPTTTIQPGQYPIRISTKAATADAQLVIKRPATLQIETVEGSQNIVSGETFEPTVHVTNIGDVPGNRSVSVTGLDGQVDETRNVSLGPGNSTTVTFTIETGGLKSGYYQYQVSTSEGTSTFPVRVLRPPTFQVVSVNTTDTATRGRPIPVSVVLTNVGHLSGNQTVMLTGPSDTYNRTVEISGGQTMTLNFTVGTDALARGNYTYAVRTEASSERFHVRIRAAEFDVTDLDGDGTYTVGDELRFSARLRNTGDAKGVQRVELRIDLDDDDTPETIGIGKEVSLAPGERTTISFTITDERWTDAGSSTSLIGTYIFGIFTDETNVTGAFAVKPTSTDSSDGTGGNSQDLASRDEISQEKYGLFYSDLSDETKTQVDEIYTRQPFANSLVVTEVLTREQIARKQFGHDSEPGGPFDFTALDIQVQQQVEAIFDAQFTAEQGDRIESWDELARMKYGQPYGELTVEQQEAIRQAYQEQFDDNS